MSTVSNKNKCHNKDAALRNASEKDMALQILFSSIERDGGQTNEVSRGLSETRERILLVDDEESQVFTVKYRLQKLGYKVVAKQNPFLALDLFKDSPDSFDLVVMDMVMPEMTGDILVEKIQKIRPDMPIILYAEPSERIFEEKAKSMAVCDFIEKPFSASEMAKSIRNVLDKRRA